jgi:shikimate dehydrogenase/3-dehydroquinate dehydratase type I
MICIPITETSPAEALRAVERSALVADAIELRMDVIRNGDLPRLMDAARRVSDSVKIIVTCRRKEESLTPASGGIDIQRKEMTKAARMNLFRQAVLLGADFVDMELAWGERAIRQLKSYCLARKSRTRVIVSWHDVSKTPSLAALKRIFSDCAQTGADVIKIVPYARCAGDNLKVMQLIDYAKKQHRDIIAMCMGESGKVSRALAPLWGSYLGFAILPGGKRSAPGQLTLSAMRQLTGLLQDSSPEAQEAPLSEGAQSYVLLGNPVRHSLSPLMHNTALQAMHINGNYSAFCVTDIAAALTGIRGMNIRGASVTIPFKTAVMEYLDDIEPDAIAMGAVNTIVNQAGRLVGYNTDWGGLTRSLKEQTDIAGKTFAILGAGGTARAAAFGIQKEGGRPIIVNRSEARGKALASRLNCPFHPLSAVAGIRADGLINATSVGMYPHGDQSPVDAAILAHFPVVADVIYNPVKTRLLRDAGAKGCKIISGLEMFVQQGAAQIKIWTGKEAPLVLMRKVVMKELNKRET